MIEDLVKRLRQVSSNRLMPMGIASDARYAADLLQNLSWQPGQTVPKKSGERILISCGGHVAIAVWSEMYNRFTDDIDGMDSYIQIDAWQPLPDPITKT